MRNGNINDNKCLHLKQRTNILPQNPSPVALFFKDGGSLANHPLSCHPQGVFGNRESGRKAKKMKKKKSRKTLAQCSVSLMQKNEKFFFTRFVLSLYSAQASKKTIIPSIPMIHEGKNSKNHKKEVKRGSKGQKNQEQLSQRAKISHPAKFSVFLHFPCLFCSSFLLISDLQC